MKFTRIQLEDALEAFSHLCMDSYDDEMGEDLNLHDFLSSSLEMLNDFSLED